MLRVLLIQLPIPQINFGKRTANVPLAGACLKQSLSKDFPAQVDILPESISSYIADAALIRFVLAAKPDVVGFSIFNWNLHRSLYVAEKIKGAYPVKIILGGPEITKDNPAIKSSVIDYAVYGEGEAVFQNILMEILDPGIRDSVGMSLRGSKTTEAISVNNANNRLPRSLRSLAMTKKGNETRSLSRNDSIRKFSDTVLSCADEAFNAMPSPYLSGLLEPHVDGLIYLESQRGCKYRCGFCYYNKSRKKIAVANDDVVVDAVKWAKKNRVTEICLIDPSLNTRPGLAALLEKISQINKDKSLSLNAEIRAEFIDKDIADGFAAAGFTSFEIGLQSTNEKALSIMRRKTDLKRFLKGTSLLKERGITPKIDLIVGLPGDDLEGFRKSLMFVAENNLSDDIQVFPLSVLPGTAFRRKSVDLGLVYEPDPPYSIIRTPTYSTEDIYLSFDYAESLFDVSLFPAPYLDISYRHFLPTPKKPMDVSVVLKGKKYIRTIVLFDKRPLADIEDAASRLTSPYQIFIGHFVIGYEYICKVIEILTTVNPFTPLEIIFLEPERLPDVQKLLSAAQLHRPNYLDVYNVYQYSFPGNRSVLFTLVTERKNAFFEGDMKRLIYWWKSSSLPDLHDMDKLSELDGILIDADIPKHEAISWQDKMAGLAEDMMFISFADIELQKRWMRLTAADEFSAMFL